MKRVLSSINIIGQRFGRLIVLSEKRNDKHHLVCECLCDCAKIKTIRKTSLLSRETQSCGCLGHERASQRMRTHGKTETKEFRTWTRMIYRCENPNAINFDDYGGRGISICDRWKESFDNFLNDMGEAPSKKHSIDRIDNNKGYSPDNCRWANVEQQQRNKRNNVFTEVNGEMLCLEAISIKYNLNPTTISHRYHKLKLRGSDLVVPLMRGKNK